MNKNKAQSAKQSGQQPPPPEELIIKFVGKTDVFDEKGKSASVLRAAPRTIINGRTVIDLPEDDVQKNGFTHPQAQFLLDNYPQEFKKIRPKG